MLWHLDAVTWNVTPMPPVWINDRLVELKAKMNEEVQIDCAMEQSQRGSSTGITQKPNKRFDPHWQQDRVSGKFSPTDQSAPTTTTIRSVAGKHTHFIAAVGWSASRRFKRSSQSLHWFGHISAQRRCVCPPEHAGWRGFWRYASSFV